MLSSHPPYVSQYNSLRIKGLGLRRLLGFIEFFNNKGPLGAGEPFIMRGEGWCLVGEDRGVRNGIMTVGVEGVFDDGWI